MWFCWVDGVARVDGAMWVLGLFFLRQDLVWLWISGLTSVVAPQFTATDSLQAGC